VIAALLLAATALGAPWQTTSPSVALTEQAYLAAYNLDYDQAIALGREAVAAAPDDPRAHRTLAVVLWLDLIFLRGAVTIDPYLNGVLHAPAALVPAPRDLDDSCRRETARAIELAEAWTKREPQSLDAALELGTAYALRASYVASITGDTTGAFGAARHAYEEDSRVVDGDPSRTAAVVVVGLYRYIVSTLALPSRLFAYAVGFGGGREKGISMLEAAAAAASHDGHVEAGVALLLIDARENRHPDGLAIATRLEQEFPRNRLFTLEAGSAAVRAGRGAQADAILTRGLAALAADARPRFPGEQALWLLKRGMARLEMGHLADAREDLAEAERNGPTGWVAGRIHLERGRVDDLEGHRPAALAEYEASRRLCSAAHDEPCTNDANHLLDKPFRLGLDSGEVPGMERSSPDRR
jgi:tetratricopeptide (TPR) repeat protein